MSDARSLAWLGLPTDEIDAALRFFAERGPDGFVYELTQLP